MTVIKDVEFSRPESPTPLPWFTAWEGWPDVMAEAVGLQPETVGIDNAAARVARIPYGDAINGAYRNYIVADRYGQHREVAEATADHLAGKAGVSRMLLCVWTRGGSKAEQYGNDEMVAILRGERDDAVRGLIRQLRIGRNGNGTKQHYLAFLHEADGYAPEGTDPALYRAALKRLLQVAILEALTLEATPYELGVGGLLTGGPMGSGAPWSQRQWRWFGEPGSAILPLEPWMLRSGYLVTFWDTYFKVTGEGTRDYESFIDKVYDQKAAPYQSGITRHVVAETALGMDTRANPGVEVGHVGAMVNWLKEIAGALRTGGLEGVALFSKPDGPASKYGSITRPGRESALIEWAWRAREMNNRRPA